MGDDADDLSLIPRSVRDKLDRVGIKLHLKEWERLGLPERRRLVDQSCDSADEVRQYGAYLVRVVTERTGRAPDLLTP